MSEIKITATDRRILSALDEHGDMSPRAVAEELGLEDHGWIGRKLRGLLKAELVRVARFERNTDGMAIPIYSVTPGVSAKRPGGARLVGVQQALSQAPGRARWRAIPEGAQFLGVAGWDYG